jgi:putative oxidoreductase
MKDKLIDLGLLWLRVLFGLALMYHGWLKVIGGIDKFAVSSVEPLGFPVPMVFAVLATGAELVGGFFLILGLWTRIAALVVVADLSVAAFGAAATAPVIEPGKAFTKELPLLYVAIAVALVMMGPGRFSVDSGRKGGGAKSAPKKTKR